MQHSRITVALLVCIFAVGGMLAFFAFGSSANGPANIPDFCRGFGQGCDGLQRPVGPDAAKVPTLAPPRDNLSSLADNKLHANSFGQPVYVQVETDRAEIEVGWAHSGFLGR